MRIIPYIEHDGQATIPDEFFRVMWRMMIAEKTWSKVFADGSILTEEQFLSCMKKKDKLVMTIIDKNEPLLLSWVTGIYDGHAFIHFNCFKSTWGRNAIELLRMAADYWLSKKNPESGEQILQVLMGAIAENNRLAVRAVKKCGATEIGRIPNYFTDHNGNRTGVYLCYLEASHG